MTRLSCPTCRLRFSGVATATLTACPECGRALEAVSSAEATIGLRLFDATAPLPALPTAAEAALPRPDLRPDDA
jgi:hypothetical protein